MAFREYIRQIVRNIPIPLSRNHLYDLQTRRIIKRICQPDSICVDVGCHKGEVLDWMIKYAPDASHYGFEPIPNYYDFLMKKYGQKHRIYPLALADQKGKSTFHYVKSNPSYSGLRRRRYDRQGETIEKIEVEICPMDSIVDASDKITFIKIDVEGAELWVLKGAKLTILKHQPFIVFETGEGGLDHYGLGPAELFDFINEQLDYEIYLLGSWLKKKEALSKSAFIDQFEKALNYYFVACPKSN